jgi:hypothetical protein
MTRYKMVARDINSNPTQWRTWVVQGQPDFDGYYYTGYKSGPNAFTEVHAYAIPDTGTIADFNLPDPTNWVATTDRLNWDFPIRKVLPAPLEDSALAVLDGYIYMFGGKITDKIYRAHVNNPADWEDTGAVLPNPLFGSSLAIVDGYIYLFGGNNGVDAVNGLGAIDNIYSAPVSNPLVWTNHGSLLPRRLEYSHLAMDGYQLYLFGGREINSATNLIFTATTSNPLSWTITGSTLPYKVYGGTLAQINNNWMIFGGLLTPDSPTNTIITASVNTPLSWTTTGLLPWSTGFGQFVNIGGDGYLIGPMNGANTNFTSILRCNLNNPNAWVDLQVVVRGVVSHSQIAIIADRVWLFGGSGLTAIFACNQITKYNILAPKAINYGTITRVTVPNTDNINRPYTATGMPWWKTDYPFYNRP